MLSVGAVDLNSSFSDERSDVQAHVDFREIDRELRRVAKRRAALDAEEAHWLREADAQQIWRKLGFSTALEYLEDVFAYAPRTALERLRVAKELGVLKELDAKLRAGEIGYGVARELSRVMTPETERVWLVRAQGRNLREIERLVAGHRKGDDPDDAPDERIVERDVVFRVTAAVEALLRQARAELSDECGHHLDDNELIELLCRRACGQAARPDCAPSPAYQVSIRKCDSCARAELVAGGRTVPVDAATLAAAECDAVLLGDENDLESRASRTIPKQVRDVVWLRDEGRCRVPGCRATRNCDVHHVIPWADGGTHDPSNLVVLCSGHHKLLHRGLLSIKGCAPDQLTFERDGQPLVDPRSAAEVAACADLEKASLHGGKRTHARRHRSRFTDVAAFVEAKAALRQLGYKAREAGEALDRVRDDVGDDADVATLVQTVLANDRQASSQATPSSVEPTGSSSVSSDQAWRDLVRDHTRMAQAALVQSGYPRAVAERAVARARAELADAGDLVTLIKRALRYCLDG